jgi:GTP cyclohydrolase II
MTVGGTRLPTAEVRATVAVPLQFDWGLEPSQMVTFHGLVDSREHLAVLFGNALLKDLPLVRVHSECLTGDVFRSARCDCGAQLQESIVTLRSEGGILVYLRQEGRDIGLYNKLDAYGLQDRGMNTYEANRALNFEDDQRVYAVAAQILFALGVRSIELLSNNPEKKRQLEEYGVAVHRERLTGVHVTEANRRYLQAKMKHHHAISFD